LAFDRDQYLQELARFDRERPVSYGRAAAS
jgi:hypothetical protein